MAKKTGRRQKLNKELIKEMSKYISNGLSNKDAAVLCDVSEAIFYRWMSDAEDDIKSGKKTLKVEFFESIKKARIKHKAWHIRNINISAEKNWTASAWRLERQWPEEFGRKDRITHDGGISITVKEDTEFDG
jgi:transposase